MKRSSFIALAIILAMAALVVASNVEFWTGNASAEPSYILPDGSVDWSQFKRDDEYYSQLEKKDETIRRWGPMSVGHVVFYGILILLALSAYALVKELVGKQSADIRRTAVLFAGTAALSISAVLAMNGRYTPVVSHNRYIPSAVLDQWTGDTCFVMRGGYACIQDK